MLQPTEHPKVRRDDAGRLFIPIECCECGAQTTLTLRTPAQLQVPEFFNKKLRQIDWEPGRDRRHDTCPACTYKHSPKPAIAAALDEAMRRADQKSSVVLDAALDKLRTKPTEPPHQQTPETPMLEIVKPAPETDEKTKRRHLTRQEEFAITSLMSGKIKKRGNDAYWEYNEGWSDQRILQEAMISGATINHVQNIRRDVFGHLQPKRLDGSEYSTRVATLERRIEDLERTVLELMDRK